MDAPPPLSPLIEDLEVNIDELTHSLSPLLSPPLSTTASSLPLLDKAKLYVLAAYAIESLLFSTLQASGASAKEHAVFPELARLKGYFGKIKEVEERGAKGSAEARSRLDVGAAQRFIKHGLAGNQRYDAERRERQAKDKARAQIKARQINKKFDDEDAAQVGEPSSVTPRKRSVDEESAEVDDDDDEEQEVLTGLEDPAAQPASKKPRVSVAAGDLMDVDPTPSSQSPPANPRKSEKAAQDPDTPAPASTPSTSTRRSSRRKPAIENSPVEPQGDGSDAATAGGKKGKGRGKGKGRKSRAAK